MLGKVRHDERYGRNVIKDIIRTLWHKGKRTKRYKEEKSGNKKFIPVVKLSACTDGLTICVEVECVGGGMVLMAESSEGIHTGSSCNSDSYFHTVCIFCFLVKLHVDASVVGVFIHFFVTCTLKEESGDMIHITIQGFRFNI